MSATGRTPLPGVQRYRVAAPVPGSPPTVSTKVWPRPPTSTAGARNCCGTLPSWVTDPACLPLVMSWLNDPSLSAYTTRPAGPTATPRGPLSPSTTGTRLLAPTAADATPAINTPAVTAAATSRGVLRRSICIQHPPFLARSPCSSRASANLCRSTRLVNALVGALDLRRCGRRPSLIAVGLIVRLATPLALATRPMDTTDDALHAIWQTMVHVC